MPPDAERFIVADLTVEAVATILKADPNGVLLARDEISVRARRSTLPDGLYWR